MTMNRRRSLLVIGCLMAAFVAFASDAAFAQQAAAAPSPALAADARGHDTIRLTWGHDNENLDKFSIRYQQATPDDAGSADEEDLVPTMNVMRMEVKKSSSSTSYSVNIEGLKPEKDYIFGLTAQGDPGADATEQWADARTDMADAPDDVLGLELMAGDAMIMAMWDETTDNGSEVTGYAVEYREKGKSTWTESRAGETGTDTSMTWTISNLENGTMYEVRVQACSFTMCGDWTDEEEATPMAGAMPTPALPVFGAFALGAGLLAAGRRRLRRRQELLNS